MAGMQPVCNAQTEQAWSSWPRPRILLNMARNSRQQKSSGPPMGAFVGLAVVMGLAIYFARVAVKQDQEAAIPEPDILASDIFGDLPIEQPPPLPDSAKDPINLSPEDIASTELWVNAQGIAKQAAEVYAEAKKAKAKDDHAVWAEKGKAAKNLYNDAIIMSVDWQEGLSLEYGDNDVRVKAITREIDGWFKILEVLAKTTGR
jgi:hypothetical protein